MFGYVRPAFWSARGPVQTAINKRVGRLGKQSAQGPWPLPERQSPDTDAFAIRRDCGAFRESVLALNVHCSDQIGVALRVKPLDTQQHHEGRPCPVTARCAWKSWSNVIHTLSSLRALSRICMSSACAIPISE